MVNETGFMLPFFQTIADLLVENGEPKPGENEAVEKLFNRMIQNFESMEIEWGWQYYYNALQGLKEEVDAKRTGKEIRRILEESSSNIKVMSYKDIEVLVNTIIGGGFDDEFDDETSKKSKSIAWKLMSNKAQPIGDNPNKGISFRDRREKFEDLLRILGFFEGKTEPYKLFVMKETEQNIQWMFNSILDVEAYFDGLDKSLPFFNSNKRRTIIKNMLSEQCDYKAMTEELDALLCIGLNIKKDRIYLDDIIVIEAHLLRLLPVVRIKRTGEYELKTREEWANDVRMITKKIDEYMRGIPYSAKDLLKETRNEAYVAIEAAFISIFGDKSKIISEKEAPSQSIELCKQYLTKIREMHNSFGRCIILS